MSEADQRSALLMDALEGEIVEVVGGKVAGQCPCIETNDVAEGAAWFLLSGGHPVVAVMHSELFTKACLFEVGALVMAHFKSVDDMEITGSRIAEQKLTMAVLQSWMMHVHISRPPAVCGKIDPAFEFNLQRDITVTSDFECLKNRDVLESSIHRKTPFASRQQAAEWRTHRTSDT